MFGTKQGTENRAVNKIFSNHYMWRLNSGNGGDLKEE